MKTFIGISHVYAELRGTETLEIMRRVTRLPVSFFQIFQEHINRNMEVIQNETKDFKTGFFHR